MKRDEVAQGLAHLLPVDGNHVVVHPVLGWILVVAGIALRDFTFVVGEKQVHAATVDVKLGAKVFGTHGRTFQVPAWEAKAPRGRPLHEVLSRSVFPQGKIDRVPLFSLSIQVAASTNQFLDDTPRKFAVGVFLVVGEYIKIYRSVDHIGEALI